jgi:hypothetical protein
MPQETKSMPADLLEKQHSVAGMSVDLGDEAATFDVLEKAFDYRGDVTLTLKDGRTIAGYLFDRRKGKSLADSSVRLMGAASDDKITVKYAEIARIAFSDRDPAAGKSFETWVKKYIEKKMAGEKASIESESLD